MSSPTPIWTPSKERINNSNMLRFIKELQNEHPEITDHESLYRWSISEPEEFWVAIWKFCGVKYTKLWDSVLDEPDNISKATWFQGSRLNFAENLLTTKNDSIALIGQGESSKRITYTFNQVHLLVAKLAHAFLKNGIQPSDRIAGYLPNIPETVICMLATSAIGAVWSSCSQDFGVRGVIDRFSQIEPKIFITADGYSYQGKDINRIDNAIKIINKIPSIRNIIVIPFLNKQIKIKQIKNSKLFYDYIDDSETEIPYVHVEFNHPLFILFSSGTTGKPKCIVHGAGGTLLQLLKEHIIHTDVKSSDVVFYFTTCGWMMWNWLVVAMATGASIVLYDGSPLFPLASRLFDLIDEEKISIFGTSAKYLAAVQSENASPIKTHKLSSLHSILSTGSPLAPEQFDFVYQSIKEDVLLSSVSGGTDIVSCFLVGSPLLPVYRGELQCRGLGLNVQIYNQEGQSVINEKGELVCTKPFPSRPIYFWNDPNNEKLTNAYFAKFPGVWAHRDYAKLTPHGTMVIYGRSDTVLNPGGVRIGTSEIYREVEKFSEVLEAIAVGQQWENDTRIILFIKLRNNQVLSSDLELKIKSKIRDNTSPRHVPSKVIKVPDIPRTVSGKIVELAVTDVIHSREVTNIDALANPEALDYFRNLLELEI